MDVFPLIRGITCCIFPGRDELSFLFLFVGVPVATPLKLGTRFLVWAIASVGVLSEAGLKVAIAESFRGLKCRLQFSAVSFFCL